MRLSFATPFPKILCATGCVALVCLRDAAVKATPFPARSSRRSARGAAFRRAGGKNLRWEGDTLKAGTVIVQLEASELKARRDLAAAQINTAQHDVEAQSAQLEFLRADAKRQQELLKSNTVSPNEAERAMSLAKAQEKNIAAARARVEQALAQLADMDAQIQEMKIVAPTDSILEVLSVKVGDVLPPIAKSRR